MKRSISWFVVSIALACAACGTTKSSNGGGAGSGSNAGTGSSAGSGSNAGSGSTAGTGSVNTAKGFAADSCHLQCEAQAKVQGCTPVVGLADCKALCDQLAASTPTSCKDKFDAYYNCSASEGFMCLASLVTQSTACNDKKDAFATCSNGGKKPSCEGQLDSGVCPQVQCPCPSGTVPVSGFDNENGVCKCYDAVTCKDFFCD